MKQINKAVVLGLIALATMFTFSFTACEDWLISKETLTSIALNTSSVKRTYTQGETLNLSGLVVTASYSDGSMATVTDYTTNLVNGTTLNTIGTITVTVSYTEASVTRTASFTVTVNANDPAKTLTSIALNTTSVKRTYTQGETLNLSDLVVTASYSDSSSAVVTNYTANPVNGTTLTTTGTVTVTVSYTEAGVTRTASFTVTINSSDVNPPVPTKTLTSIALNTASVKNSYTQGETLNLSGLVVTASYSDSSSAAVTNYTANPTNGASLNTTGTITITVSYSEDSVTRTASFTVDVNTAAKTLMSIALNTASVKNTYTQGETLNLSGLVVTASYSDSSSAVVTNYTTSPTNGATLNTTGTITITVSYAEEGEAKITSFTITVNAVSSAENPFIVNSVDALKKVGTGTDGWTRSAYYKQTANIVFSQGDGNWTPIGSTSSGFTGSYDGGGYTIQNLTISGSSSSRGLFGYVGSSGTVKNVKMVSCNINGNSDVGGVAGWNHGGTVENCYVTGNITGTGSDVGGVVGWNLDGTVKYCYSTSSVTGNNSVGGVVGSNSGSGIVENCYATGNVTGGVGGNGLVGGGGGVVGMNSGTVENCYATGNINGDNDIGGVVGYNDFVGIVKNCYASGNVTGSSSVGGVVGTSGCKVENCIALNWTITSSSGLSPSNFGRVVGDWYDGTLTSNYARSTMSIPVSVTSNANGIHGANITSTNWASSSWWTGTAGWSTSVWNFSSVGTNSYPQLRNMP